MTEAAELTIGGLLVIVAWGGGWLVLQMVQCIVDQIATFCGADPGGIVRRPRPRDAAAYHHAADHDAPYRALIRVDHGAVTHWYARPPARFSIGDVAIHGRASAPETIGRASGNSPQNTIGRGHD